MDLNVISPELESLPPAFMYHPAPVKGGLQQGACTPAPGEGPESPHLQKGYSNVAPVPDNVYKQWIRDVSSNSSHVQDVIGIVHCPSLCALILCDFVHDDADKVSSITAFRQ